MNHSAGTTAGNLPTSMTWSEDDDDDNSNEEARTVRPETTYGREEQTDGSKPKRYTGWKEYIKSPMGLSWIGLVLSFVAVVVGLQMLLTTDFKSNDAELLMKNAAGMDLNATKEYWLASYHQLNPPGAPPVVPGSFQWNALQWLTTADPLAPLANSSSSNSDHRLVQRYALACLYYHWDGPSWLFSTSGAGWLDFVTQAAGSPDGTVAIWVSPETKTTSLTSMGSVEQTKVMTRAQVPFHECEWLGVTCNDRDQVIGLDFKSASFVVNGNVPSELGLLSHLTSLDVAGKSLSGAFPRQLPLALPALTYLDLQGNRFYVIDQDWGAWSNLETVNLAGNAFQGSLPAETLAKWTKIRSFDIQDTAVTGNFWQDIVPHWPLVERLEISMTELTGSIPEVTKDGPLSQLKALYASQTALTGTLPASLSLATNLQILQLTDMSGEGMTPTPFPTEFGRLTNLQALGLSSSSTLTGTLPTEIGLLTLLDHLNLYSNPGLNGTIPTEFGNLKKLEFLKLCYTDLSGSIPKELGTLDHLMEVLLHKTDLVGTIPPAMCSGYIGVLTADCGILRQGDTPAVECKLGCCECYT